MKTRVFLALTFALTSLVAIPEAARCQTKSAKASPPVVSNSLSTFENDVLAEINEVRAHPEKYITYLEGLKPYFKDKEYQKGNIALLTQEGWSAVDDAIKFLKTVKPQPAFSVSPGLCLAATSHVKEQGSSGATGHKGTRGSMIEDRVKPFGTWSGGIGENLSYGKESPRDRVLTWLIDDGVATRGHRKRLLSPDYKVAGLSCGNHPEYGMMCALTLAGGFSDTKSAGPSAKTKPATVKPATKKPTKSSRSSKGKGLSA